MNISPQDKALLITFSGASMLVLAFFFLGFAPFKNKIPEEFYEIPLVDEAPEVPEEPPLTQSPQVKEQLSHQAVNSSRLQREANRFFNQEDEVREAIQSESSADKSPEENSAEEGISNYEERIAALQQKREENNTAEDEAVETEAKGSSSSNRRTTISYNLIDRNSIKIPNPVYTCDATGKVVINIEVGDLGNVIKTSFNKASSTTTNGCLIDQALKYAGHAIFNSASRESQLGTITFEFQG